MPARDGIAASAGHRRHHHSRRGQKKTHPANACVERSPPIVVYPEGTRIKTGTHAHYKTGGSRLALALGIPIVPVAHNAGYLWPKGVLGKRSGTVTVSIGPPIRPEGKDMQRLTNEVETWIEDEVARLGNPLGESPVPHG